MNSEWINVSYKNKRAQKGAPTIPKGAPTIPKGAPSIPVGAQKGTPNSAHPAIRSTASATQVKQGYFMWEQKRLLKIKKYDQEFPILPGTKDLMTDALKIQWYDQQEELKRQQEHQAYLKRKAKRENKLQIPKVHHIQNMIEKWGEHRWHRMVHGTDDDCDEAYKLRDQEEREEHQREMIMEERITQERKERQEFIDKSTQGMTQQQKSEWLFDFEEEEYHEMCENFDTESNYIWKYVERVAEQDKRDKERLDLWNLKQAFK
jgi:hypothetical protein